MYTVSISLWGAIGIGIALGIIATIGFIAVLVWNSSKTKK
jgi:hypothetical protein